MITVHRIAHQDFISDLQGVGARLFGGRWNPQGVPCLYCSEHLSLALLEKFVHAQGRNDMQHLATLSLRIPAACKLYTLNTAKMDANWRQDVNYTQWLGQQILEDDSYGGFRAPSVIIPGEWNVVLNPRSLLFKKVQALPHEQFVTDERLLLQLPE